MDLRGMMARLFGGAVGETATRRSVRPRASLHDAAASSRRLKDWDPTDADISTIASSSGDMLVRRARDLVLGNAYAASGKEEFSAALVGTGIRPASTIEDEALQTRVMQLWSAWCEVAEEQGSLSLYGIQDIIAGALFEAGEVFVRVRPRRLDDGLPVPLQLQVLESEYCDRSYSAPVDQVRRIRAGIEFGALNERVAYHFWRNHPGDRIGWSGAQERVRVPADSVVHVFDVRRPSQLRGLPMLTPGMVRMRIFDDYDDSELERKRTASLVAGFVTKSTEGGFWTNETEDTDDEGIPEATARWSPGTICELLPDENIEFSAPTDVGTTYEMFQYRNLLAISAAIGIPYVNLTGDVRQANYSSLRAALLQFRRRVDRLQAKVMIHQFCRPVWSHFIDAAVLSGALSVSADQAAKLKAKVIWIPPKWEWVDPLKDRQAEQLAVEMRVKPRSQVIIQEGGDPEQVDQQIAADQARAERLGIAAATQSAPLPVVDEQDDHVDSEDVPDEPIVPSPPGGRKARPR